MPLQCVVGSIGCGVCYWHDSPQFYTTTIVDGSENIYTEGPPDALIGSTGIASCGHPTVALTGSTTVLQNERGPHRIGDTGINGGLYHMVTSVSTVEVGD